MDGVKGDKGDMGLHGLRGFQVEINKGLESYYKSFLVVFLCSVFFYREIKESLVCQGTKGGRARRCCGLSLSVLGYRQKLKVHCFIGFPGFTWAHGESGPGWRKGLTSKISMCTMRKLF